MAVLIDASILIEAERGRLGLAQHVAQRQEEEFFLSVITASELLHKPGQRIVYISAEISDCVSSL